MPTFPKSNHKMFLVGKTLTEQNFLCNVACTKRELKAAIFKTAGGRPKTYLVASAALRPLKDQFMLKTMMQC